MEKRRAEGIVSGESLDTHTVLEAEISSMHKIGVGVICMSLCRCETATSPEGGRRRNCRSGEVQILETSLTSPFIDSHRGNTVFRYVDTINTGVSWRPQHWGVALMLHGYCTYV